jgi:diadenosine tetraphosphate (Ap4A) HIT family hydrolase
MNYEALGNSVAHLHWWLTPRHRDDPHPRGPIWEDAGFLDALRAGPTKPGNDHDAPTRTRILTALEAENVEIEMRYV